MRGPIITSRDHQFHPWFRGFSRLPEKTVDDQSIVYHCSLPTIENLPPISRKKWLI